MAFGDNGPVGGKPAANRALGHGLPDERDRYRDPPQPSSHLPEPLPHCSPPGERGHFELGTEGDRRLGSAQPFDVPASSVRSSCWRCQRSPRWSRPAGVGVHHQAATRLGSRCGAPWPGPSGTSVRRWPHRRRCPRYQRRRRLGARRRPASPRTRPVTSHPSHLTSAGPRGIRYDWVRTGSGLKSSFIGSMKIRGSSLKIAELKRPLASRAGDDDNLEAGSSSSRPSSDSEGWAAKRRPLATAVQMVVAFVRPPDM